MTRPYVSASELARFSFCEMQWALERHNGFRTMSHGQLARLAVRGQRSRDPNTRALGLAAAAYLERVRPALRRGEQYHTADARFITRRHPFVVVSAILAAVALLALAIR